MPIAKHNVCLIDDDHIYQFAARKILEATGLAKQIRSFYNGSEAILYFNDFDNRNADSLPDIIFLDINMPVMNGWQFLEEYQKLYPILPKPILVYVVSSSVDDADIERSRAFNTVRDYIVKPVNRVKYQELLEAVDSVN